MKKVLRKQEVFVGKIGRITAISMDTEKEIMVGIIGKSKFVWRYKQFPYPTMAGIVECQRVRAAKYGRLYILERLKMEGIVIDNFYKKEADFIHLSTENGVWCNLFDNGYVRGEIDGIPFAWNCQKHREAVIVTEAGTKGNLSYKVDTDRIRARLKAAGYNRPSDIVNAVKALSNEGEQA